MTTTVAIDKSFKLRAEKRSKKAGLPLSVVVKIFLNDYADGKLDIGSIRR